MEKRTKLVATGTIVIVVIAACIFVLGLPSAPATFHSSTGSSEGNPSGLESSYASSDQSKYAPTAPGSAARSGNADNTLANRYERTSDLFGFTLSMRPLSDTGNGEASRLIAEAYAECWTYALDSSGFLSDMHLKAELRPDLSKSLTQAYRRVEERCRFFRGAEIGPKASRELLRRAASQGDVAAQVKLFALERGNHKSGQMTDDLRKLGQKVLVSRDPYAFAAFAEVIGTASLGRIDELYPMPAGTVAAEAAWQIAACRLGRNCGPSSTIVTNMCINGGMNCSLRSLEVFYTQEMLPPAELQKVRQHVIWLIQRRDAL